MSFKDLMTYKRILIRHIYTSVNSWCQLKPSHFSVGPFSTKGFDSLPAGRLAGFFLQELRGAYSQDACPRSKLHVVLLQDVYSSSEWSWPHLQTAHRFYSRSQWSHVCIGKLGACFQHRSCACQPQGVDNGWWHPKQGDVEISDFPISLRDVFVVDVSFVCEFMGSSRALGGWNNSVCHTHDILQARANVKNNEYLQVYGLVKQGFRARHHRYVR